ncbi:MAG: ATP-dependent Clp protease adapter ClpS [Legionella sp.]|jgi:ATP-dependent Clp protease adaptor protein ClpS|nr:ATP-dependent Clp protease adapter ClpS [Legionella sp.]
MPKGIITEYVERVVLESSVVSVLEIPKKYSVVLYNDDYTPMGFVVEVLKRFFLLTEEKATQVMMEIHKKGRAVCGVYTRDVAETIVELVNDCSRKNQYPLLCVLEADEA